MKPRGVAWGLLLLSSGLVPFAGCSSEPAGSAAEAGPTPTGTSTGTTPTPGADAGADAPPTPPADASADAPADAPPSGGAQDRVYYSNAFGFAYLPIAGGAPVVVDADLKNALRVRLSPDRKRVATTGGFGATTSTVYDRANAKVATLPGVFIGWADNDTVLYGAAGGVGNQGFADLRRARFDGSGEQTVYRTTGAALFRVGTSPLSADGGRLAVWHIDGTTYSVKVVSTTDGAEVGSTSVGGASNPVNGPLYTRDGSVVWAAATSPTSYQIASPTLTAPRTVTAPGALAGGNGNGAFAPWIGDAFLLGAEVIGGGGLRQSKLFAARSDGAAPVELSGLGVLGNLLVERVKVSADGGKIVYNLGKIIWTARVDGTDARQLGDVTIDPQTLAW